MGGAEIYRASLPQADRLYVTEVHAAIRGRCAPDLDWRLAGDQPGISCAGPQPSGLDYSFCEYERPQERIIGATVTLCSSIDPKV